jgi:hypothetical protein
MIVNLEEAGLQLEAEDDVAGFLGVLIERKYDRTIIMTQPGITQRIVKALKIDHLPPRERPPSMELSEKTRAVRSHIESTATHSLSACLDICKAIAVATLRGIHCIKRSHEEALERIGQYLKAMGTTV